MANCNTRKKIVVRYGEHAGGKSYLCFADEPDFTGHVSRYYALIDLKLGLVRTFKLTKTAWQYIVRNLEAHDEIYGNGTTRLREYETKLHESNLHAMQHLIWLRKEFYII